MDLNVIIQPAKKMMNGRDAFTLTAGKRIRVRTTPDGDVYLNEQVPEGKQWKVSVSVQIEETDA